MAKHLRSMQGKKSARLYTERINTAQTRYFSRAELRQSMGTGARPTAAAASTEDAVIVSHDQVHDPALNRIFPVRSPADPTRIDPCYADPVDPTRCAEGVTIKEARFSDEAGAMLWHAVNKDPEFNATRFGTMHVFLDKVRDSVVAAIQATMQGDAPPGWGKLKVVRLERHHCETEPEADAMEGQYGVVADVEDPEEQPLLRNGDVAGLFAASRIDSDEAMAQYKAIFGEELAEQVLSAYAFTVSEPGAETIWAPYGGGNDMQFVNSAFRPGPDGELRVDEARVHGIFAYITATFIDKDGIERIEKIPFVAQILPLKNGKQFLINYGPDYILSQDAGNRVARMVSPAIKVEPADEDTVHPGAGGDEPGATSDDGTDDGFMPAPTRRQAAAGGVGEGAEEEAGTRRPPGKVYFDARNNGWIADGWDSSGRRHRRRFNLNNAASSEEAHAAAEEALEMISADNIPPKLVSRELPSSRFKAVKYDGGKFLWRVGGRGPSGKVFTGTFTVRAYGSVEAAQSAAEEFWEQIQAGDIPARPAAKTAIPKSSVPFVRFHLKRNRWHVGGPNPENRKSYFPVGAGTIEAAREAAEEEALARAAQQAPEPSEPAVAASEAPARRRSRGRADPNEGLAAGHDLPANEAAGHRDRGRRKR